VAAKAEDTTSKLLMTIRCCVGIGVR
jgi:hypothetical protein